MGGFLLGIGLLRAIVAVILGAKVSFAGLWPEGLWYIGGFVGGGALVGLCWPMRQYRVGRVAIWILGMIVVMLVIIRMESGPLSAWKTEDFAIGGFLAVLFGIAAAAGFERG